MSKTVPYALVYKDELLPLCESVACKVTKQSHIEKKEICYTDHEYDK